MSVRTPLNTLLPLAIACLGACLGAACGTPHVASNPSPLPDSAVVRTEIDSAMHRYNRFMRAGPPDSLAAMFAEDGDVYDGENALRGRSAIRAFYEPLTRNVRIESATTTTRAIESWGTRVLQWGEYVQNASQVGGPVTHFRGRFVAEWERGPRGQWLIRRIMVLPLNSR